jgi:high-affinity iron transporter
LRFSRRGVIRKGVPLKTIIICTTVALTLVPSVASAQDELRQVAGILDYIGSDYAGAVDGNGQVVNDLEYREQFSLAADAKALARSTGLGDDDAVVRGLDALVPMLEAKVPPADVLAHCRAIKQTMVEDHDLVLAPSRAPDPARASELYFASACNTCHGDDGGADTDQARELDPPPANFLDPERVAGVSPYRAFYAISFGVEGTGMTGYDALSEEDRWSLAFWVLALRHRDVDPNAGQALVERGSIDASAGTLSQLTEDDLRGKLGDVLEPDEIDPAMAYLRAVAPFDAGAAAGDFGLARDRLREGVAAYRAGRADEARSKFVSAYLDGFEPHEPALRARDSALVDEIEKAMLALREQAARGAPASEIERRAGELAGLLDRAEGTESSVATAFVGSAAISLREGFEAVLLITALLALVRRRGSPSDAKWVHAGWIAALPAGLLTWLAAGHVLGGLQRELAEGIVALAAAFVLLGVTHWIVGQATARGFMGAVGKRLEGAVSSRGAKWGVLGLAFVAVYREAFEVVLFYQAMLLDAAGDAWVVLLGAVTGLVVLAALAFGLKRIGQKLKPRPFMLASSAVLAALAVMLVGKGVRAMQEAGVMSASDVGFPDVPTLGVYGTAQGLLAQGALVILLAASALWPWLRARRENAGPAAAE